MFLQFITRQKLDGTYVSQRKENHALFEDKTGELKSGDKNERFA